MWIFKDVRVGLFSFFILFLFFFSIKNKLGRYSVPPLHLSSACDTCGRLDGEENAPAIGGDGYKSKKPSQWTRNSNIEMIQFNEDCAYSLFVGGYYSWNMINVIIIIILIIITQESNKSIGGIWGNLTESKRAEISRGGYPNPPDWNTRS